MSQQCADRIGDALYLPGNIGRFDVVLMANLLDRLSDPRQCLAQMADLINPNGQLIITSPYTWMEEFTPVYNWLGGIDRMGERVSTLDSLRHLLEPNFELVVVKELPFLLREHARKYQWSIAQASLWMCRDSR
jgi:2-polyprenyl-3-methyl-5-hydroxy-6-metoxy-1,4-benzoquinol methylase